MLSYNDCIVFLLAKAYQKAHATIKKRVGTYGLTPMQLLVIHAIREEEGLSSTEIGNRVILDSATLAGVLDRLAQRDWIVKKTDPEDKRALNLYLGQESNDLIHELIRVREEANEEILAGFSVEEKVLLKRLLRDVWR